MFDSVRLGGPEEGTEEEQSGLQQHAWLRVDFFGTFLFPRPPASPKSYRLLVTSHQCLRQCV